MERLSHAYIVSAASRETQRALALELAARILCSGHGEKPCGVCRDCRKVYSGNHPDVGYVARRTDDRGNLKRDIAVDQIREMGADAVVLPNEASGKVYIIEEAEAMNPAAQNAALKLLEEPPAGVHFLLCTDNPEKLLPTVRSRCVLLRRNGDDEAASPEMQKLAAEYVGCLKNGGRSELTAWCFSSEQTDSRKMPEFIACAQKELARLLCDVSEAEEKRIMDNIAVLDRAARYLRVNTSPKHIFGLLAVRSLPLKETEK